MRGPLPRGLVVVYPESRRLGPLRGRTLGRRRPRGPGQRYGLSKALRDGPMVCRAAPGDRGLDRGVARRRRAAGSRRRKAPRPSCRSGRPTGRRRPHSATSGCGPQPGRWRGQGSTRAREASLAMSAPARTSSETGGGPVPSCRPSSGVFACLPGARDYNTASRGLANEVTQQANGESGTSNGEVEMKQWRAGIGEEGCHIFICIYWLAPAVLSAMMAWRDHSVPD